MFARRRAPSMAMTGVGSAEISSMATLLAHGSALAVGRVRMVLGESRNVEDRRPRRIDARKALVDEQHFVRPAAERLVAGLTAVVVDVNVRHVKKLLQAFHHVH